MRRTTLAALAALALAASPAVAQLPTYTYAGCSEVGSCHWVTLMHTGAPVENWPGRGLITDWRIFSRHTLPDHPNTAVEWGVYRFSVGPPLGLWNILNTHDIYTTGFYV